VAQIGMGEVLRQWNDLEGAEDLLRRGITLCAQWGSLVDTAVDGYLSLARVLLARGDVAGAEEAILLAETAGREDNTGSVQGQMADARVAVARIDLWLRTGEIDPAMRWAAVREEALNMPGPTDDCGTPERLALARLSLAQRRYDEALRPLAALLEVVEGKGWTAAAIEVLVLQALSYAGGGQTAQAMLALKRALSLAEPEGYVRVFVDEGASMAALLRHACSRGLGGA
jgi:LuxR family maltose regulon positive regulatory protein